MLMYQKGDGERTSKLISSRLRRRSGRSMLVDAASSRVLSLDHRDGRCRRVLDDRLGIGILSLYRFLGEPDRPGVLRQRDQLRSGGHGGWLAGGLRGLHQRPFPARRARLVAPRPSGSRPRRRDAGARVRGSGSGGARSALEPDRRAPEPSTRIEATGAVPNAVPTSIGSWTARSEHSDPGRPSTGLIGFSRNRRRVRGRRARS